MGSLKVQQLAGIFGIAFVVMSVIGAAMVQPPPTLDHTAEKFATYYTDHRSRLLLQAIVSTLGIVPAFVYLGGLWRRLLTADGDDGVFALGALLAFVTALTMALFAGAGPGGLAMLAKNGLDADL